MSLSHPIGDMLTRIRNGQNAGKEFVTVPNSNFHKEQIDEHRANLVVELKYINGNGAIQDITVVSKPGRRVYSGSAKMPRVLNGLGIAIVSTPNGVMTDHKARLMNVGGEVLCKVI